jgi:hypothetical protein
MGAGVGFGGEGACFSAEWTSAVLTSAECSILMR